MQETKIREMESEFKEIIALGDELASGAFCVRRVRAPSPLFT